MAREKLNIPRAKRPGFGEPNRSWLSGTFGSGSIKRKSLGNHHKVVTIWKIIPIGGLPTALAAAAATDDCFPSYFFFVSNFLCFKGYFDQHRRQRNEKIPIPMFRPTVHVFLSYCFSLNSKLSQWRRFFCFVCFFFFNQFLFCYTQKFKKNVERVHFLFPLPSVIYSKNAITWLFFFCNFVC